jgi:hypothetical protein
MDQTAGQLTGSSDVSLGDAFTWASRDPSWISKVLIMGLIGLIPIVGALQLIGWMLAGLDNLRTGRQELPQAGFRYASRGVWLFLAGLIYGVVILVVFYAVLGLMVVAMTAFTPPSSTNSSAGQSGFSLIVFPLMFGFLGLFGLLSVVLFLFVPLVIEFTDRKALRGAFDIGGFIHAIRISPRETLAAGALTLVAYLISGIGTYLCWVGVIFTFPYALTVLAGVLRWYELKAKPGALTA